MNIVLFEAHEIAAPLPAQDERSRHVQRVLNRVVGDEFDVGLINGPRGKATLTAITSTDLHFSFDWSPDHTAPASTTLLLGLPRPQTARDILRDATTLGATSLQFVKAGRTDPNYAASSLWKDGSWRRQTILGAAQAFDTYIPDVTWDRALSDALENIPATHRIIALDNYGTSRGLHELTFDTPDAPIVLCLGPERGWDDQDRATFAARNIPRVHLGERVLRLETAVTVALGLINAARLASRA